MPHRLDGLDLVAHGPGDVYDYGEGGPQGEVEELAIIGRADHGADVLQVGEGGLGNKREGELNEITVSETKKKSFDFIVFAAGVVQNGK